MRGEKGVGEAQAITQGDADTSKMGTESWEHLEGNTYSAGKEEPQSEEAFQKRRNKHMFVQGRQVGGAHPTEERTWAKA